MTNNCLPYLECKLTNEIALTKINRQLATIEDNRRREQLTLGTLLDLGVGCFNKLHGQHKRRPHRNCRHLTLWQKDLQNWNWMCSKTKLIKWSDLHYSQVLISITKLKWAKHTSSTLDTYIRNHTQTHTHWQIYTFTDSGIFNLSSLRQWQTHKCEKLGQNVTSMSKKTGKGKWNELSRLKCNREARIGTKKSLIVVGRFSFTDKFGVRLARGVSWCGIMWHDGCSMAAMQSAQHKAFH